MQNGRALVHAPSALRQVGWGSALFAAMAASAAWGVAESLQLLMAAGVPLPVVLPLLAAAAAGGVRYYLALG